MRKGMNFKHLGNILLNLLSLFASTVQERGRRVFHYEHFKSRKARKKETRRERETNEESMNCVAA